MVYIYIIPLQLVPDEAYYWDWSRHLDIGYFSKPPMVAWLNYISQKIFGINEIGVRFFAALLGTGSVGVVYLLAKKMFDEEVGIWALAISLLTPANCALSLIMTIDPPLVFFGILSLFFLWKATSAQDNEKIFYFALLGLSTGLGILSKQMMLIYFLLVFVFCL
jgi:undecaprenyl-diphosphatase